MESREGCSPLGIMTHMSTECHNRRKRSCDGNKNVLNRNFIPFAAAATMRGGRRDTKGPQHPKLSCCATPCSLGTVVQPLQQRPFLEWPRNQEPLWCRQDLRKLSNNGRNFCWPWVATKEVVIPYPHGIKTVALRSIKNRSAKLV